MPLAARLMLQSIESIPESSWRLASQLGMRSSHIFRLLEWPLIRGILPGLASLIFMLCFTSFTTVLALGGGPKSTTLEVAVYQALPGPEATEMCIWLGTTVRGRLGGSVSRFTGDLGTGTGMGMARVDRWWREVMSGSREKTRQHDKHMFIML